MTKLTYAGIGPRKTPAYVLNGQMDIAGQLSRSGWVLRSGHAEGADTAFEAGSGSNKEIFLPWDGFNGTWGDVNPITGFGHYVLPVSDKQLEIARRHHPAWDKCSRGAKALLCRNVPILLGRTLDDPVDCVITWLPTANYQGGTRHALNIASTYGIPVFDLNQPEDYKALVKFVDELEQKEAA